MYLIALKLVLRWMLWKYSASRKEIRKILRDEDMLAAVAQACESYAATEKGYGSDTPFLDILQFLMDNSDKILEIIVFIIGLFAEMENTDVS